MLYKAESSVTAPYVLPEAQLPCSSAFALSILYHIWRIEDNMNNPHCILQF